MNILLPKHVGGAFGYITEGWLNALVDAGHNVKRYDDNIQSWLEFKPDLYCGCSGHKQTIPANRGKCLVAIHVNPYGTNDIDKNILEPKQTVNWVLSQKPNVVFGYGLQQDRLFWAGWEQAGIKWVPMPTAGDAVVYNNSNINKIVDYVYVGGRWSYKSTSIDKFLLPVVNNKKLNGSVYGWGDWSSPWPSHFVEGIDDKDVPARLSQAKVGPCISEPHTQRSGIDLPERVFKVVLSGAVAVHDTVAGFDRYCKSVLSADSPDQYVNEIRRICDMDDSARSALSKRQRLEVLNNHTYHHRMSTLFDALGLRGESNDMLLVLNKVVGSEH